jgi:hypothetical protein
MCGKVVFFDRVLVAVDERTGVPDAVRFAFADVDFVTCSSRIRRAGRFRPSRSAGSWKLSEKVAVLDGPAGCIFQCSLFQTLRFQILDLTPSPIRKNITPTFLIAF